MAMKKRLLRVLAALVLLVVVAGCGGVATDDSCATISQVFEACTGEALEPERCDPQLADALRTRGCDAIHSGEGKADYFASLTVVGYLRGGRIAIVTDGTNTFLMTVH